MLRLTWDQVHAMTREMAKVTVGVPPQCDAPGCTEYGYYRLRIPHLGVTYTLHACADHKPSVGCQGCIG